MDSGSGFTLRARTSPSGGARVAWSYLASLFALVLAGLGLAVVSYGEQAWCAEDDYSCSVAVYLGAGIVGGLLTTALAAWLFRLGWEWGLAWAAILLAMPALLDLLGIGGWVLLGLTPALAALVTWGGVERPRWRPWAIGAGCAALATGGLILTFVTGG